MSTKPLPFLAFCIRTARVSLWLGGLALMLLSITSLSAAPDAKYTPNESDISYGNHPHQIMDVYLPPGNGPFPVLIWFGGGQGLFKSGKNIPDLSLLLPQGVAVVSVQYRSLSDAVKEELGTPIAISMSDARRAVQFVRYNAAKWKLNPDRIGVAGGSQGTLPSLYVACAGEQADLQASDPVEKTSSQVTCVGAMRSQPSIDPKRMQEWVPGVEWGSQAFGMSFQDSQKKRDDLLPIINKWSPDALVNKDTPPIYFENNWGLTKPDQVKEKDYKVHSPAWGLGFQKLAKERGNNRVYVKYPGVDIPNYPTVWDFLVKMLKDPAN